MVGREDHDGAVGLAGRLVSSILAYSRTAGAAPARSSCRLTGSSKSQRRWYTGMFAAARVTTAWARPGGSWTWVRPP
ncbi:hypothetical protein ACFQ7Z_15960 [Streptomyces virginiae]|uniref:hypothetical protein n=1 Tax=Streptomyces virginiae TaxID=1961 RepID=UPI00369A91D3